MSKDTQIANIANLAKGLAQSAQSVDSGGGSYLKFTKFGEWTWGTEDTEAEPEALWGIHPQGFQHGWIAWGDKAHDNSGSKLGETMSDATEPLPLINTLPEVKGAWAQQISMQLVCLSGMDKGVKVIFNSCSTGGRKAYHNIVNAVVAELNNGSDGICPVVTLGKDHYTHKDHGKIFTPVIDIDSWKTLDDLTSMLDNMDTEDDSTDAADAAADAADEAKAQAEKLEIEADASLRKEKAKEKSKAKESDEGTEAEEHTPRRRRRRS